MHQASVCAPGCPPASPILGLPEPPLMKASSVIETPVLLEWGVRRIKSVKQPALL